MQIPVWHMKVKTASVLSFKPQQRFGGQCVLRKSHLSSYDLEMFLHLSNSLDLQSYLTFQTMVETEAQTEARL